MAIFDGMNRNRENIELHHDILDRIDKKYNDCHISRFIWIDWQIRLKDEIRIC